MANREVVEAGVATASDTTSCIVFISLTGTSGFSPLTMRRRLDPACDTSMFVLTAIVISVGTLPSSSVAPEL